MLNDYLIYTPEILSIVEDTLDITTIDEIQDISEDIVAGGKKKDQAVESLQNIIGIRPKRPIYYLNFEVRYLDEMTRNTVRYAGDYVDHLVKHLVNEKGSKGVFPLTHSLGSNVKRLKGVINEPLYNLLDNYNKYIYVPAKHDMEDHGRPHLFTTIDAVAICYLTMEISKKIIKISKEAEDYSTDHYHNSYQFSFKD